ncbi:DNA cytosine methyltransferase [Yinghuangia sp. YIM S10712]|uniref:DNA cytosine methyltransferase n=1 Tax=Yinghuangia sp. YIM S10712 TaxID=3436930 RepID=UPI003F53387A
MAESPSDRPAPARSRIVDLFAGPGGLDVAAQVLDVPAVGIEWDDDACLTRAAAGLQTVHGDVRDYNPEVAPFQDATVLTGGPPCQTFTVAGSGAGRRALYDVLALVTKLGEATDPDDLDLVLKEAEAFDDERTALVLQPLKWALHAHFLGRPYEAIVLEQVPAVLPVWEAMGEILERIGYRFPVRSRPGSEQSTDRDDDLHLPLAMTEPRSEPRAFVFRTEEYGVPQTRRRAVLIARLGSTPRFPAPTHQRYHKGVKPQAGPSELHPYVSMGQALDRTDKFVVVSNYGSGGDPRARGRRDSSLPSATVTGKISRNRLVDSAGNDLGRFTDAEAGCLQTFPRAYPWRGKGLAQQIGNAVPPRLGVHILSAALGLQPPTEDVWKRLREWLPPERKDG